MAAVSAKRSMALGYLYRKTGRGVSRVPQKMIMLKDDHNSLRIKTNFSFPRVVMIIKTKPQHPENLIFYFNWAHLRIQH